MFLPVDLITTTNIKQCIRKHGSYRWLSCSAVEHRSGTAKVFSILIIMYVSVFPGAQ